MSVPGVQEFVQRDVAGGSLVKAVAATLIEWCDDMEIPAELRSQAVVALASTTQ